MHTCPAGLAHAPPEAANAHDSVALPPKDCAVCPLNLLGTQLSPLDTVAVIAVDNTALPEGVAVAIIFPPAYVTLTAAGAVTEITPLHVTGVLEYAGLPEAVSTMSHEQAPPILPCGPHGVRVSDGKTWTVTA